jgi:hypothetical protein
MDDRHLPVLSPKILAGLEKNWPTTLNSIHNHFLPYINAQGLASL